MSRNLHANMAAEIIKKTVNPILLFECTLADTSVARYWTGYGTLSWNGNDYIGSGMLIGVGPVQETDEVQGQGVSVTLNGVPLAAISLALSSLANGKQGILRLGFRDSSNNVISNPKIMFRGRLDLCEVEDSVETPTLKLNYEHELSRLEIPNERRWTDQEQKRRFPGDRGLEGIARLQDLDVPFGNKHKIGI